MKKKEKAQTSGTGVAGDLMKKALTVGVSALFTGEEGLKKILSESKLPQELWTQVGGAAAKTRDEFLQRLSSEIVQSLSQHVDLRALIEELVTRNEVELTVKLNLKPKSGIKKTS